VCVYKFLNKSGQNVYLITFEDKTNFLFVYNMQMEVKKGNYTFFITNNIETWNGVITGINYKICGNIRDCVNISVQLDNNVAVSASIPPTMYDEECSLYEPLGRGEGSIIMIKTLLIHIKSLHPELEKIRFDDMSSIECATHEDLEKKGTNLLSMPLYYLSIAYNGETWYEKYFRAVQEDTIKQNAYRVRVNKMLNDITEKPTEYIDFLKITKVPMNIRVELESFYTNSKTYSGFFHLIPKQHRCRLLMPWIKEFMNYYLKGVFSNFDWEIQLSNISDESLSKTRKTQNKGEKKYYCPNGFNRNMNYLKDIGANVL